MNYKINKYYYSYRGFTLIELLVVISIIGVLVAITTANLLTAQKQARDSRRMQDMEAAQTALETSYVENQAYPIAAAIDAAFDSGTRPNDPKNDVAYSYSWNTDADSYCICATLESKTGNASAGTSDGCTWTGTLSLFCVQNRQ